LGKLYVANSVNLATRVRIDILKAIAKKITNTKESAHVASYSSRPILHVRTNQTKGEPISRAYTFIDAVIKFGKSLVYEDLGEAYRRAGTAFRGQMEQHYVVLRKEVAGSRSFEQKDPKEPNPAKRWPNSGKRGRENEGDGAGSTSKTQHC
jgi:hypothetical protein